MEVISFLNKVLNLNKAQQEELYIKKKVYVIIKDLKEIKDKRKFIKDLLIID